MAEAQFKNRAKAQNGRVPTNSSGLDLTPAVWAALGFTGNLDAITATVSWDFVDYLDAAQPAPPTPAPTPSVILTKQNWPTQAECPSFYGNDEATIRASLVNVSCPWLMNGNVRTIQVHQKCAASLARVLNYIWEYLGKSQDKIHEFGYDIFDGSFVPRNIAGTGSRSMHWYGVALDFDAAANPQHAPLSQTKFKSDSLIVFAFKAEGWIWGGDWSSASIDAMHVQAARVR